MLPEKHKTGQMQLTEQKKHLPVNSIQQAIQASSKCVGQLDREAVTAFITLQIDALLKFMSITRLMNGAQMEETSVLIVGEFGYLKLEDLDFFFRRIKTGFYGELYNRLDGQVLMSKLREYCAERIEKAEVLSLTAHKETKLVDKDTLVVKVDGQFVIETEKEYNLGLLELATDYSLKDAIRVKDIFIKSDFKDAKILSRSKAMGKFFERVDPKILHPANRFKLMAEKYEADKKAILDSDKPDFEKHNLIRALANLSPVTEQEFLEYQKALIKP